MTTPLAFGAGLPDLAVDDDGELEDLAAAVESGEPESAEATAVANAAPPPATTPATATPRHLLDRRHVVVPGSFASYYTAVSQTGSRMSPRIGFLRARYHSIGGRDRKSTRLNSSHIQKSRMPSSA